MDASLYRCVFTDIFFLIFGGAKVFNSNEVCINFSLSNCALVSHLRKLYLTQSHKDSSNDYGIIWVLHMPANILSFFSLSY